MNPWTQWPWGFPWNAYYSLWALVAAMTVIIPLDGVTVMSPGKLYSIDLEQTEDGYVGTVRPWRVTDVEPPIKVAERTVANTVTLEALP
jgi:hypothetical protein